MTTIARGRHRVRLPVPVPVRPPKRMTAQRMAARFRVMHYAFSLGHQRSICVHIGTEAMMQSTYHMQGESLADYKRFAGEGVFRLSVGLEDPRDLIGDLDRALAE